MRARYFEYGGKLALVSMVAMVVVAGAWVSFRERIDAGRNAAFTQAISEVLGLPPGADAPEPLNPDAPPEEQVFKTVVDGEERYAVQGSHQGFSSKVVLAVGARRVDEDLEIIEVRVISQAETPGLGTRIQEQETNLTLWSWLGRGLGMDVSEEMDWYFLKRFRGKTASQMIVTGSAAEEEERILKITGVTVTCNAATLAAKKALAKIADATR